MAANEKPAGTELVVRGTRFHDREFRAVESEYQGLWFTLSRLPWRSLVVVPVDEHGSAAGVATALTDVARRLRQMQVTFLLMTGPIDYASAGRFISAVSGDPATDAAQAAKARVIVSVPPVTLEPLALAVTGSADAVAICVRKGSSHLAAAARTLDLVGRDRVVGCIVV